MSEFDFDACVVGAGAVGLACGYALARRGLSVVVLEQERAIGQGVSSRNSEVVHGGLYYPTGSLKARFCVAGRRALYRLPRRAPASPIASAASWWWRPKPDELPRIEAIAGRRATTASKASPRSTGAEAHRAWSPACAASARSISPQSGVFDSHGYMLALQGEIEDRGGAVVLATPFEGAAPLAGGGFAVRAGGEAATTMTVRLLVTAPGLSRPGGRGPHRRASRRRTSRSATSARASTSASPAARRSNT